MKDIKTWNGRDMYIPFTHNTTKKELRNSTSQLSYVESAYFFDKTSEGTSPANYNRNDVEAELQGLHLEVGLESGLSAGLPIIGHESISKLLTKTDALDKDTGNPDLNLLKGKKGVSFFSDNQHLGMCLG